MKKQIGFLLMLFVTISCNKDPAISIDSNFSGTWYHYETTEKFKYLIIEAGKSKGEIWYSYGWDGEGLYDTQRRKWFVHEDQLEFGHVPANWEKFHIDTFPQIAMYADTVGLNPIAIGNKYMWLDERIFVTQN